MQTITVNSIPALNEVSLIATPEEDKPTYYVFIDNASINTIELPQVGVPVGADEATTAANLAQTLNKNDLLDATVSGDIVTVDGPFTFESQTEALTVE